jgi:microcystin-dependent protein
MSFRRIQSRAINHNVYLENRLSNFASPPVHTGDLIVERDETVNGNLTVNNDLNSTNYYASGNFYLHNFVLIPAGTIIQFAGISVPGGWLNCDGTLISVVSYADLFDAIGYTYGGSEEYFRVPDMRGRVGVGFGQGVDLTDRTLAATGGEETHVLTIPEMPTHNHDVTDPGHAHSYVNNVNDQGVQSALSNETAADQVDISQTTGTSYTGIYTNNTGSSNAHNNMQPFLVVRYLIKY